MRKWLVFSASQPLVQGGFNVSLKLFLNLCSWKWLSPSHNLNKYLAAFRFYQLSMLFAPDLLNFKIFFLKVLRLGAFKLQVQFNPFNDDWRKKVFLKLCSTLKWGILFAFLLEYGLFDLGIIFKKKLKIGFQNFIKQDSFLHHRLCSRDSKPSSSKIFSIFCWKYALYAWS